MLTEHKCILHQAYQWKDKYVKACIDMCVRSTEHILLKTQHFSRNTYSRVKIQVRNWSGVLGAVLVWEHFLQEQEGQQTDDYPQALCHVVVLFTSWKGSKQTANKAERANTLHKILQEKQTVNSESKLVSKYYNDSKHY